jgi:methylenetetrahydrofolate--tRNA-(uracil-5-)-methyltransferase
MSGRTLVVVGGGLAGCEAAWQAAERGVEVVLVEMRPVVPTGAHQSDRLAELVCSNSLGSALADRASGILMAELEQLGSLLLGKAREAALPAGGALAVDRILFAESVTKAIEGHPRVHVQREEARVVPEGLAVIASGPLTSAALAADLERWTGEGHLYFYDALAPIVEAGSIDLAVAFRASRYGRGQAEEGDYLNCPLDRNEYERLVDAFLSAERRAPRESEAAVEGGVRAAAGPYFEGCLPVEEIAARGRDSLAFGPLRPVGLRDPRTGKRPHAVVQLRQDNVAATLYNLVGFQTTLTVRAQQDVFRMIPGLERARFVRFGQMHRNTFVNAPRVLRPTLQLRGREELLLAGQITGVEGYLGNIATGLLAGVNAALLAQGLSPMELPATTMLGALCRYITQADPRDFQPMKGNLGLLDPLPEPLRGRCQRRTAYALRASEALREYIVPRSPPCA